MKNYRTWLIVLLIGEVVGCGLFFARRLSQPSPPIADLSLVDPVAAKNLQDAISRCRTAADWKRLAGLYMATGYFSEAEICHRVACQRAPDDPLLAYQWGFSLERLGLLEDANREYEKAVALGYPHPEHCWYFIGRNLLRLERLDDAIRFYEQGKKYPGCKYELAKVFRFQSVPERATELFAEVEEQAPMARQPHYHLYRIELDKRNSRAVFIHADLWLRKYGGIPNPFDHEAARLTDGLASGTIVKRWNDIVSLIDQKKFDAAEKLLNETKLDKEDGNQLYIRAKLALARGKTQEAIRLCEKAIEVDGGTGKNLVFLGTALELAQDYDTAKAVWTRGVFVAQGSELIECHNKLRDSYQRIGNQSLANHHSAKALCLQAQEQLQLESWPQALEALEKAVQVDSTLIQAWYYLGELHRYLGDNPKAEKAYKKCLELNPYYGKAITILENRTSGK